MNKENCNAKNDLATAGMVCSIIGFLGVTAIYGLILSIFGLKESKKLGGKGKAESVVGIIIGTFFILVFMLLVAIADNSVLETKQNSSPIEEQTETSESSSTSKTYEVTPQKTEEEIKNEFINDCKQLTYQEIARNPDNYYGTKATFTGKVIQVQEGILNNIVMRVDITKEEYEYLDMVTWKDTIYVEYKYAKGESKILEDDIITLYGTMEGSKTYTSVLGSSITLPKFNAKYIIINE